MKKFLIYFSFGMSIFFIGAAILLVVYPPDVTAIRDNKFLAGFVLLMYGLLRLYRSVRMMKGKDDSMF